MHLYVCMHACLCIYVRMLLCMHICLQSLIHFTESVAKIIVNEKVLTIISATDLGIKKKPSAGSFEGIHN